MSTLDTTVTELAEAILSNKPRDEFEKLAAGRSVGLGIEDLPVLRRMFEVAPDFRTTVIVKSIARMAPEIGGKPNMTNPSLPSPRNPDNGARIRSMIRSPHWHGTAVENCHG